MSARSRSTTYVALLRGVNVSGKNKLPMADLVAMFEDAGATNVSTYIQSGNVVFDASAAVRAKIAETIHSAIEERFGFRSPVILRSAAEMRAVVARNPFAAKSEERTLHVVFLADRPKKAQIDALDPARSPGDSFAVVDGEVYLHLPNGVGRSKITNAWLDAKLGTVSTIRNWRTVNELARRARESG